jgi:hypothetical protein
MELTMRLRTVLGLLPLGLVVISCKERGYNKSEVNLRIFEKKTPPPYHAFLIWRDNAGPNFPVPELGARWEENGNTVTLPGFLYPRPTDKGVPTGKPDGVFYVAEGSGEYVKLEDNGKRRIAVATATEGATVLGDVLTYPDKEGRKLSIRFLEPQKDQNKWYAPSYFAQKNLGTAFKECLKIGGRLPTVRELYDFCNAPAASEKKSKAEEWCNGTFRQNGDTSRSVGMWSLTADATNADLFWWVHGKSIGTWANFEYLGWMCVVNP